MKKITLVLASVGLLSCSSFAFASSDSNSASTPSTNASLQQEINTLQAQLAALETKINTNGSKVAGNTTSTTAKAPVLASSTAISASTASPTNVAISPYVGVAPSYDGSNLVVNNPGVNNDVALLKLRQSEITAVEQSGQTYEGAPKLIFSGEVEGTSVYTTPYTNTPAGTNFNLTDAEIDTFIEGNRWVSGYMTFGYDSGSDGEANPVNNSEIQLGQGYVTVGDFTTSPFYGTAGQMYVPFGRYLSYMVSTPSTKTLGRVQTRAINLGYHSSDTEVTPFAAVYGYQGATEIDGNPASNDDVEGYGANLGFDVAKGDYSAQLGSSFISNIADSSGMQGDGSSGDTFSGFSASSSDEELAYRVPGIDVYGEIGYKDYALLAEFVEATKDFAESNMTYNGSGARPKAVDIEAAYSFEYWRPSYVALDYGQTWQSLALGLPQKNYGIVYSTAIWQNTALSFEVMHNLGYSSGSTATGSNQAVDMDTVGESYNTVSLRFDLFF